MSTKKYRELTPQGQAGEMPANDQESTAEEPFDVIAEVMAHFIDTFRQKHSHR